MFQQNKHNLSLISLFSGYSSCFSEYLSAKIPANSRQVLKYLFVLKWKVKVKKAVTVQAILVFEMKTRSNYIQVQHIMDCLVSS